MESSAKTESGARAAQKPKRAKSALGVLLRREFVGTLRLTRSFVMLCVMIAALIWLVYAQLPRDYNPAAAGAASRAIFGTFTFIIMFAALFFIPPLAAVTIWSERQNNSLEVLLAAPIRPRDIVLSKILGVFGFFLMLLLAGLPVVGVLFFLVGVDWIQFGASVLFACATALVAACIGVSVSATQPPAGSPVSTAYSRVFIYIFLIPIFIPFVSPLSIFFLFRLGAPGFSSIFPFLFVLLPVLYLLMLVVVFFERACRFIRREPVGKQKPVSVWKTPVESLPTHLLGSAVTNAAVRNRGAVILSKSFTQPRRRWGCLGLVCLAIAVPMALIAWAMASSSYNSSAGIGTWLSIEAGLLLLVAPSLVATRISREYEQDTFDLLRMTLLRPRALILGHIASALLSLAPLLLAVAVSAVAQLWASRHLRFAPDLIFFGNLAVFMALLSALCIAQFMALFSRRSMWALILSYAGVIATPIILAYLVSTDLFKALAPSILSVGPPYKPGGSALQFSVFVIATSLVLCPVLIGLSTMLYKRMHLRQR